MEMIAADAVAARANSLENVCILKDIDTRENVRLFEQIWSWILREIEQILRAKSVQEGRKDCI